MLAPPLLRGASLTANGSIALALLLAPDLVCEAAELDAAELAANREAVERVERVTTLRLCVEEDVDRRAEDATVRLAPPPPPLEEVVREAEEAASPPREEEAADRCFILYDGYLCPMCYVEGNRTEMIYDTHSILAEGVFPVVC